MSDITTVQSSHSAFAASLLEAIRRAAIQLPDPWRWVQFINSWDVGNYTYKADNRLQSYTITKGGDVLTVTYAYNASGRISSTTLVSPAGTVTVTPTYDANGNVAATTVTVV